MISRRTVMSIAMVATLLGLSGNAAAQGRVSDKDLEKLINNLKEDSKKFSESFKQDVSKSTIRKTSDEKTAKQAAERFPKQLEGLLNQFKSKKHPEASLPVVNQTCNQLSEFMGKVSPSAKTSESWNRVRQGMDQVNNAFNFNPTS